MKTKYLYIITLLLTALVACEKDGDEVVAVTSDTPELMASVNSVILLEEQAEDEAILFTHTEADFGFNAAESYKIQFDTTSSFTSPRASDIDSTLEISYTVRNLNSVCVQLGLKPDEAQTVYARLRAYLSNDVAVYSEPIELTVTPYLSTTESPYADLYMIGPATEIGWGAASDAIPMFRDPENSFVYTFTGDFNAGELKLLGSRGNWQPQWGSGGEGQLAIQETNNDTSPPGIMMTAGYQTITVNIQTLTYTIDSYNASGATIYSATSLSGDFNSWGNTPMSNSTLNPHIWMISYDNSEFSKIKFRTDGEWWGIISGDQDALYGTSSSSSSAQDIFIEADSYLVVFNDLTGQYIFIN